MCAALGCFGAALADSAQASTVSTNWAGYAATPSSDSSFTSVSGAWTEPQTTCASSTQTYSAVWVGLGGYNTNASALEQIGTEADCTASGAARYSSWYELVPAGPVNVSIKIRPGDRIVASVTVQSHGVTLRLRDLTSGKRFSTTRRVTKIDDSSAEWIVEAPSVCVTAQSCTTLPLTNFGTASFTSATAIADGHTGTIDDPDWSANELELQQSLTSGGPAFRRPYSSTNTITVATPSAVSAGEGAFSVSYQQRQLQSEQSSAPTLPGFSASPP